MQQKYERPNGTTGVKTINNEPSLTEQQFKDETDANLLMKRLMKTGQLPKFVSRTGVYGDFTEIPGSYHEAMEIVRKSEELFLELPSELRKKFDNDPQKLMDYLADEKNNDESYKLGLRNHHRPVNQDLIEAIKENTETRKRKNFKQEQTGIADDE